MTQRGLCAELTNTNDTNAFACEAFRPSAATVKVSGLSSERRNLRCRHVPGKHCPFRACVPTHAALAVRVRCRRSFSVACDRLSFRLEASIRKKTARHARAYALKTVGHHNEAYRCQIGHVGLVRRPAPQPFTLVCFRLFSFSAFQTLRRAPTSVQFPGNVGQ